MHKDELEVISQIKAYFEKENMGKDQDRYYYRRFINDDHKTVLEELLRQGIGKRSAEFIAYIKAHTNDLYMQIIIWMDIETYLLEENEQNLAQLNTSIRKIHEESFKATGEGQLPDFIIEGSLLKNVYLQGNKTVVSLFKKYLPLPPAKFFEGHELPPCIAAYEKEKQACLAIFRENNKSHLSDAVDSVIKIQRFIRGKLRRREEVQRIKKRYKDTVKDQRIYFEIEMPDEISDTMSKCLIADADTPYRPQMCSEALADRIVNAVKKVELFSTVRTLTATQSIDTIFDTAFFANRTLKRHFIPFRWASLYYDDVMNGDGNAICFGPNMIDPKCLRNNTTEITLDLKKLIEKNRLNPNPCIFFKQRDFGYRLQRERKVFAKNSEIPFTHTDSWRSALSGFTYLQILTDSDGWGKPLLRYFGGLPHYHFIAYDLENIHQILTCNFFRLLDGLLDNHLQKAPNETKRIYDLIAQLSDEELVIFLTDLGKQMSDTCEFNFYGAYRIDFDLILTIRDIKDTWFGSPDYILNLPEFIADLQRGNVKKFSEAKEAMPNVFQSVRFMEYLLTKVDHSETLQVLQEHCMSLAESKNKDRKTL